MAEIRGAARNRRPAHSWSLRGYRPYLLKCSSDKVTLSQQGEPDGSTAPAHEGRPSYDDRSGETVRRASSSLVGLRQGAVAAEAAAQAPEKGREAGAAHSDAAGLRLSTPAFIARLGGYLPALSGVSPHTRTITHRYNGTLSSARIPTGSRGRDWWRGLDCPKSTMPMG